MLERLSIISLSLLFAIVASAQDETKLMRDSLQAASDALRRHPESVTLRMEKAAWNVRLEQWDYALSEYTTVLESQPDNVKALLLRAYANERLARYDFARLDYEAILKLQPDDFNATLGLALLNQKDKHYTEALNMMNMLIARYPESAVAYAARGGMETENKAYATAEYDFTEAMRLDPANTDYVLSRMDARLSLGKYDAARSDLDKLVKMGVPRPTLAKYYKRCKEYR